MPESRRVLARPKSGDVLESLYVDTLRDLSEAAQTSVVAPNTAMYRGTHGGTVFATEEVPTVTPVRFFVRLVHTGDDLYTAYGIDDIDHTGPEFAAGLAPKGGRPFGTTVDITKHAEFGMAAAVTNADGDKVITLLEAFGEEYDTKICAEPPP